MPVSFVILFEGRNGSSYLVSCLNSHPSVCCYPDILANQRRRSQHTLITRVARGHSIRGLVPDAQIRHYFHGHSPETDLGAASARGLKCKLTQPRDMWRFYTALRGEDFRLVYLRRRNTVKAVVSLLNAERLQRRTGRLNAERPSQRLDSFIIDPEAFASTLHRRIRLEAAHHTFYEAYDGPKRALYYEGLLSDHDGILNDLLEFIGVELVELRGRFHKSTPDNLREAIRNFDELRTLLSGTSFESMLLE